MDWSLGQVQSKHFLLRDHLFYKKPAYYYTAIIMDVILRFQWIFYAFFSIRFSNWLWQVFVLHLQKFSRRFIWVFRLENEHCTNVILFRASRFSPLPYRLPVKVEERLRNWWLLSTVHMNSWSLMQDLVLSNLHLKEERHHTVPRLTPCVTSAVMEKVCQRLHPNIQMSFCVGDQHWLIFLTLWIRPTSKGLSKGKSIMFNSMKVMKMKKKRTSDYHTALFVYKDS